MRKWIALGLAACMTVSSLTGCGSSQKETEAESPAAERGRGDHCRRNYRRGE